MNGKYREMIYNIEYRLMGTKIFKSLLSKETNVVFIKTIVHYIAIIIVPGYLFGTCLYYVFGWIKR